MNMATIIENAISTAENALIERRQEYTGDAYKLKQAEAQVASLQQLYSRGLIPRGVVEAAQASVDTLRMKLDAQARSELITQYAAQKTEAISPLSISMNENLRKQLEVLRNNPVARTTSTGQVSPSATVPETYSTPTVADMQNNQLMLGVGLGLIGLIAIAFLMVKK